MHECLVGVSTALTAKYSETATVGNCSGMGVSTALTAKHPETLFSVIIDVIIYCLNSLNGQAL